MIKISDLLIYSYTNVNVNIVTQTLLDFSFCILIDTDQWTKQNNISGKTKEHIYINIQNNIQYICTGTTCFHWKSANVFTWLSQLLWWQTETHKIIHIITFLSWNTHLNLTKENLVKSSFDYSSLSKTLLTLEFSNLLQT